MFSCVSPVFFVVVCNLNVIGLFFQILFFKFHVNKQKLRRISCCTCFGDDDNDEQGLTKKPSACFLSTSKRQQRDEKGLAS